MRPRGARSAISTTVAVVALLGLAGSTAAVDPPDTLVSVGSPTTPFSANKQNEPAIAVDAAHPNVLAAGANDEIDMESCAAGDPTTCPFTQGVGVSGIYFSFDSGGTWVQPTYSGWSARDCHGPAECVPHVGPIGTLPGYYENGLTSDGDPALAFGPQPGSDGTFSWSNGSRLYYANLTSNFSASASDAAFKGYEALAVSRTDDLVAAAAGDANAWFDPVVISKQSATTFSDKEQIWADNASSSPYFGNVYVCNAVFRSNSHGWQAPAPIMLATSTDGGDSWKQQQVGTAVNNPFNPIHGYGASGCTIRTDSGGVVYVFANQFAVGEPGAGYHTLVQSFDGGKTWTKPRKLFHAYDTCNYFDPVLGRCAMDGINGARDDLSSSPSVDIANGAPTGAGATNAIVDTWVDGADGLNNEHVKVTYSSDGGASWATPTNVERPGDRGLYAAVGVSPDGSDAYLVYNAFTTPFRWNTTDPRALVGVVLHADIASGAPGAWTEIHRGASGDPRGTTQNGKTAEFLGDYVYAVATNDYGAAVWNDARNAADCPAIDAWRAGLQPEGTPATNPAPGTDCPATFGNSDIYGGAFADPTP